MRNFFLLLYIFIFLFSCTKSPKVIFDKEAYLEQGKKVEIFNNYNSLKKKEVFKINKLIANKHQLINFKKIFKKKNIDYADVFLDKKYVFVIDKKSNLFKLDFDLNIIKKIKLYKNLNNYNYIAYINIFSNELIITDNLGNIASYNIEKLSLNWIKKLTVPFVSKAVKYADNIYALNINSKVYSFSLKRGEINWSFETASKVNKSIDAYKISINEDKLFFSNDYAEIYSIDLIKKKLSWSIVLENKNFNLQNINFKINDFVYYKNNLYISSNFGEILAVNIFTGKIIWKTQGFLISNFYFYKNKIIFFDKFKFLNIVNALNGETEFRKNFKNNLKPSSSNSNYKHVIFIDKKYLYIFSFEGIIQISLDNLKESYIAKNNYIFDNFIFSNKKILFLDKKNLYFFYNSY